MPDGDMKLRVLSREDLEAYRDWRHKTMETLRTPILLTKEMQDEFYSTIICNRNANHRYWGIWRYNWKGDGFYSDYAGWTLIGVGGVTNISWENRNAEISLVLGDGFQGKGYGYKAAELLYDQGFNYMNLETIYGEVYWTNPRGLKFWFRFTANYGGSNVTLSRRKYWKGRYYDSDYFTITKEQFNGAMHKMWDTEDSPDNEVGRDTDGASVSGMHELPKEGGD